MNVTINGQARTLDAHTNLDQLVELLDLHGKRLAIEVNQEIIPRSQYVEHALKEQDVVEIVQAIGGG